ncbi:type IV toxin-antitoxin system AbiEi family antitoxin domain-containing protein [Nonomuraea rhizosphaerae]|uniref:type IV toxin-antitoxin system AbiEi family antitoxin domain-containing protein n=1 Tax=Nonomuraea rhizosphaerae TaxID=2665663 RepID=UPI001C5D1CED|nr:type IV toxin-antitoxin system AbiEi family antitoxin domain-containing protein [Nonomuraea rhizosphaerae]
MVSREETPRARLWRRAAGQCGYFTAAQALEDGYSYQSQHFQVRRGHWTRVHRGVYRFQEFTDLPSGGQDHLVPWILWSHGRAVVSHVSALAVHDLGIANPAQIHLTVPPGFRQRHASVVLHRGELMPDEFQDHEGFRVTTPVRAIAESAADGVDQDVIDSAVTDLLDRGAATRRQLLLAAQRAGSRAELAVERALRTESG